MSRFFVGQRVLLARPARKRNKGKTGRIRELWPEEVEGFPGPVNCSVDWDDGVRDASYDEDGSWATHTDQLEPVLDGHQSCEENFKRDLDRLLEREGATC